MIVILIGTNLSFMHLSKWLRKHIHHLPHSCQNTPKIKLTLRTIKASQ